MANARFQANKYCTTAQSNVFAFSLLQVSSLQPKTRGLQTSTSAICRNGDVFTVLSKEWKGTPKSYQPRFIVTCQFPMNTSIFCDNMSLTQLRVQNDNALAMSLALFRGGKYVLYTVQGILCVSVRPCYTTVGLPYDEYKKETSSLLASELNAYQTLRLRLNSGLLLPIL